MDLKIRNKKALVIGAGSLSTKDPTIKGIGTCIVEALSREGVKVNFTYNKSKEGAKILAKQTKDINHYSPKSMRLNLNETFDIKNFVEGEIPDILVVNAGTRIYSKDQNKEEKDKVCRVNFTSARKIIENVSDIMTKHKKEGRIIVISSFLAGKSHKYLQSYCNSKKLINDYVLKAVPILAKRNIGIVSVCPGFTRTPMIEKRLKFYNKMVENREIPLGRIASPQEIAEIVTFLSSSLASQINGLVYCDGGSRYNFGNR